MLKRLVENDIILNKNKPQAKRLKWWFREVRSPEILVELAKKYPKIARGCILERPLLSFAVTSDMEQLKTKLNREEINYRHRDVEYWAPLRKELEILRHQKLKKNNLKK